MYNVDSGWGDEGTMTGITVRRQIGRTARVFTRKIQVGVKK